MQTSEPLRNEPRSRREPRINVIGAIWAVFSWAAILATLFTAWTPLGLIPLGLADRIRAVFNPPEQEAAIFYPTATPRPRPRIGIVAGHYQNDSGAVCSDGLTEAEINLEIATLVRDDLIAEGYDVVLLAEFDERLNGFEALTLVSIHADSCDFVNNEATGFKVSAALAESHPEKATRLVACISTRYAESTGLRFHPGSITRDMTNYHAFNEIHNETTAAIIETGFMNLDRQILTQGQDKIAQGITNGILCFIRNEDASSPTPQP